MSPGAGWLGSYGGDRCGRRLDSGPSQTAQGGVHADRAPTAGPCGAIPTAGALVVGGSPGSAASLEMGGGGLETSARPRPLGGRGATGSVPGAAIELHEGEGR